MGRKSVVKSFEMIHAISMASNITSAIVNTINLDQSSIYISWSGAAPVGEIQVEAQNGDLEPWYTLDFNDVMSVSGSPGDMQLVFSQMPFTSFRLQYIRTSGTGTISAVVSMKVVGA